MKNEGTRTYLWSLYGSLWFVLVLEGFSFSCYANRPYGSVLSFLVNLSFFMVIFPIFILVLLFGIPSSSWASFMLSLKNRDFLVDFLGEFPIDFAS